PLSLHDALPISQRDGLLLGARRLGDELSLVGAWLQADDIAGQCALERGPQGAGVRDGLRRLRALPRPLDGARDRGAVRIGPVALTGLIALVALLGSIGVLVPGRVGGSGGLGGCVLRLGAVGGLAVGGGGGAAEESGGAEPGSDGEHDDENAEQCDQGSGA